MKLAWCLFGLCALFATLVAQTRVGADQIKNVTVSPIQSVERWECTGSGTGTNPNGTTYIWDCGKLRMIRLILTDGTILGPYVAIDGRDVALDAKWSRIPLAAPDYPRLADIAPKINTLERVDEIQ